uniref:Uncharacterized protein n=1 Tax=Tanacetum cinerariifolium TaxID=118510 RepID=A0A6L2P5Y5_TANCI|nr:hypothetical protein [Tanacetum cinerariifolium]
MLQITGTSNRLKIWSLTQCKVKCRLAMITMHSGESYIGGENDNNYMDLRLTGNMLVISTPNAKSSLSQSFKLSNGIITSIWIGSLFIEMVTSCIHSKKAISTRFAFNTSKTCCFFLFKACGRSSIRCQKLPKKLNLTKPDTYRSDLKRREAYTTYSNPRGFIYQKKDKKNRLMRIDEQHKFSDGTLNDVRTALDDRLKGVQIKQNQRDLPRDIPLDSVEVLSRHGPNDAMHNPSQLLKVGKTLFQNSQRFTHFYKLSHSEFVGIEKVADPHGFKNYFNQKWANDKAIFILRFIANCFNVGHLKMEVKLRSVKVQDLRERCIIKAFKLSNQARYEHVGPEVMSSQDDKVYKMVK